MPISLVATELREENSGTELPTEDTAFSKLWPDTTGGYAANNPP